jgi:hypothetical protein
MSGNLLNTSEKNEKTGLMDKLKGFFNKEEHKEYSDDFAKEKEIIANYKNKLEKESRALEQNDKTIERETLDKKDERADTKLFFKTKKTDTEPVKKNDEPDKKKKTEIKKDKEKKEDKNPDKKKAKFSFANIGNIARQKTNAWQAPKMVTTNLIQSEILTYMDWSGRIKFIISALVIPLFIMIFIYGGLIYWDIQARTEANVLGGEIDSLNKKVAVLEKNVASVDEFKGRLSLINNLLDKHIYWTKLFAFLESNILSDSQILGGFSGDINGQYNLNIVSTSYSDVPEQILVLRNNEQVESVEITEAKQGVVKAVEIEQNGAVTYNLKLSLDPRIFYISK